MADTLTGDFPNISCSDCGKVGGVCFKHWGHLVPAGKVGVFDIECWRARTDDSRNSRPIRPLGVMSTVTND